MNLISHMSSTTRLPISHTFPPSPALPTCTAVGPTSLITPYPSTGSVKAAGPDSGGSTASLLFGGLHTPPEDGRMGTTYQAPNLAYENPIARHSAYASTLTAASDPARSAKSEQILNRFPLEQTAQLHSQQSSSTQSRATATTSHSLPSTTYTAASRPSTRPSTPNSTESKTEPRVSTSDSSLTTHSMRIPSCISPRGGSLSDFAAQLTCLFWFENPKVVEAAEILRTPGTNAVVRRFTKLGVPTDGFKSWVRYVLGTTQVTANVVLLALLFIYRLKKTNPTVNPQAGSEFRLLTVGLMLGNKFLDDNTYTNKTWAEVSGISVVEIHLMEVEFLSNLRYSLLASAEQWEEWLVKLARFWEYCERAQRLQISPIAITSPAHRSLASSPVPSPTAALQMTPMLPSNTQHLSPAQVYSNANGSQLWPGQLLGNASLSPLATKPEMQSHVGKRLLAKEDVTEPPAKRLHRQTPSHSHIQHSQQPAIPRPAHSRSSSAVVPEPLRLPVPNLTLNTHYGPGPAPTVGYATNPYATQTQSALSLPPLIPGMRAMATVYPSSSGSMAPQTLGLIAAPSTLAPSTPAVVTPTTAIYPTSAYGTPTKRLSPQNALTPAGATPFATSSPLADAYAQGLTALGAMSGIHTPISNSPSIYLQQRPSPYKPVRMVNTLLYPPPSASLQDYHLSSVFPASQMHYQPLGRRHEFRTGIVPEFVAPGPFGAAGRHHAITPTPIGLPTLPPGSLSETSGTPAPYPI